MENSSSLQVFLNGDFVPAQQAYLHISDLAVQRGYGVFDFFKVEQQTPLFLNDYLNRFYTSAELMYLPVPYGKTQLREVLAKLMSINRLDVSGVKMLLTGGYSENGFDPATPNFFIQQQPLVLPSADKVEKGISVITHEYLRDLPVVKSINYTTGIRLLHHMRAQHAEEVLYFSNNSITEFPRCNFFLVTEDDTVVTPAHNVLKGITRKNVLRLAGEKYKVEERNIILQEVYQAKEAFLTSTTKRILPIVQVDQQQIGTGKPGAVTLELLNLLIALERKTVAALAANKTE